MPGCFVIERLMCKLRSPARELSLCYGRFCDELMREAEALIEADQDRPIDGEAFCVTQGGRPLVGVIAECFFG